jgi:hypothetical protein
VASLLRFQPELDQATDGLGAAKLVFLHGRPGVDVRAKLFGQADRRYRVPACGGATSAFFGNTLFDLGIKCITINASRGEVLSFRPGSNPDHPE